MKYLKTYENNITYTYNIGDYVILNIDKIIKNYIKDNEETPRKEQLPDDNIGVIYNFSGGDENYPIAIQFHNNTVFEVNEQEIIRKATQQEIDDIKIKITANKFNL